MNPSASSCEIEIRVRYAEVDQMGVVHHSRYWVYFEMGRTELLRSCGVSYRQLELEGVFFAVVRCSAKFHAPARYDDVLVLKTTLAKMGRAKIDHAYELKRKANGALIATAEITLGCLDRDGTIIPIPESVGASHPQHGG